MTNEKAVATAAEGAVPDPDPMTAERLVFAPGVAERLQACVYLLIDPRNDRIFYVRKGRGDRAYAHATAAFDKDIDPDGRSWKLGIIREIHAAGLSVRLEILRHGMDDATAFEVEAAAIDLVRRLGYEAVPPTNVQSGRAVERGLATVDDLAARYGAPKVGITDALLLIRPTNQWRQAKTDDDRYEATRKWWVLSRERRKSVTHAAAVVDGIVRAVWRINGWEDDASSGRSAFVGVPDPVLESRYLWADVTEYASRGAQNPIRYAMP